jgi:long-chain acyl-CoA synthetase
VDTNLLTFPTLFAETLSKYGDRPAMALVGEEPMTYIDLDQKIKALMAWLEKLGIKPGDRIAILSASIPNWGVSYYAITFMGAVVVPLLPDFHTSEIRNIITHSEAKAILVSDGLKSILP